MEFGFGGRIWPLPNQTDHQQKTNRDLESENRQDRRLRYVEQRPNRVKMLFLAHLKRILRLDRLRLRGPNGGRDEFLLAAIAQILRKIAKPVPDTLAPA